MKSIRGIFGIFAVIVLGMTVWFIVAKEPEAREVKSDDGVVTITGLSRTANDFSVVVDNTATVAIPLVSHVYHVAPTNVQHDAPIILSFERSATAGTLDATAVYWFDVSLGMWERLYDVVADTDDVLAVRVSTLGDFALGITPKISAPIMLSTFGTLLRVRAPNSTRGYGISLAYTLPDGVPVRLEGFGEYGGCGGNIGAGDHSEFSSSVRTLFVPVDDVDTLVEFTLVGEWVVSADGTGCATGEELRARE
ncbi:MAG: hypothetical protein AAB473_03230 [Patescibacteria group bacterium]